MQAQQQSSPATQNSCEVTSHPSMPFQSAGEALSSYAHVPVPLASDEMCDNQRLNNLLMALHLYPGCWRVPPVTASGSD